MTNSVPQKSTATKRALFTREEQRWLVEWLNEGDNYTMFYDSSDYERNRVAETVQRQLNEALGGDKTAESVKNKLMSLRRKFREIKKQYFGDFPVGVPKMDDLESQFAGFAVYERLHDRAELQYNGGPGTTINTKWPLWDREVAEGDVQEEDVVSEFLKSPSPEQQPRQQETHHSSKGAVIKTHNGKSEHVDFSVLEFKMRYEQHLMQRELHNYELERRELENLQLRSQIEYMTELQNVEIARKKSNASAEEEDNFVRRSIIRKLLEEPQNENVCLKLIELVKNRAE
jgi:hypothetical protein